DLALAHIEERPLGIAALPARCISVIESSRCQPAIFSVTASTCISDHHLMVPGVTGPLRSLPGCSDSPKSVPRTVHHRSRVIYCWGIWAKPSQTSLPDLLVKPF